MSKHQITQAAAEKIRSLTNSKQRGAQNDHTSIDTTADELLKKLDQVSND